MAEKRWKVRVFVKSQTPGEPGREEPSKAFEIVESQPDRAALATRARLEENGCEVLTVSHAPGRELVVTIAREPRKGPPAVLVAHPPPVVRPRVQTTRSARQKGQR